MLYPKAGVNTNQAAPTDSPDGLALSIRYSRLSIHNQSLSALFYQPAQVGKAISTELCQ